MNIMSSNVYKTSHLLLHKTLHYSHSLLHKTTYLIHVPCTREEPISIFVEADSHNPVCQVESLLDTVTVVDINI